MEGKRLKKRNELAFHKNKEGLFKPKKKMSTSKFLEMRGKLDKDIMNIVDYSLEQQKNSYKTTTQFSILNDDLKNLKQRTP